MTVLVDDEIRLLAQNSSLIDPFDEEALQPASYDLKLGSQHLTRGHIECLTTDRPTHVLEPGQFILLTSRETLAMPNDLAGRAGLVSRWAKLGLISLFSPQIDPGFKGILIVPLFNGGHLPITLTLNDQMFTVEFVRTQQAAGRDWIARGNRPLLGITPSTVHVSGGPDLSGLTKQVGDLRESVGTLEATLRGYQIGTGQRLGESATRAQWLAVFFAVLAFIASIVAIIIQV